MLYTMRVPTFCRRDLKYLLFAMSVERMSQDVYLRRYYSEFKEIKMSFVCDWIMCGRMDNDCNTFC